MPKKKGEVKEGMKYMATVMEITHGRFFFRHKHYDVNVLEVPAHFKTSDVMESAEKAMRIARKAMKLNVRVLTVEEVEVTSRADMKAKVEKFREIIKK